MQSNVNLFNFENPAFNKLNKMENFTAYNPTVLHFGRNILTGLGGTLKEYG